MNHKAILILIAALALASFQLGFGADSGSWDFREDPLSFHENLRRRSMEGIDNRDQIAQLHREFGEHSFDGLLGSSPKGNAGFILLYSAWLRWEEGAYDEAARHYRRAGRLFEEASMASEARFCLYYRARIEAELENFPESILLLRETLARGEEERSPYLEGLIHESMGYALWYMDRLPESSESFSKAADLWLRVGYQPGLIDCWSNLGLLFQELGLPDLARRSYEKAVSHIRDDTYPEIKFLLYRNCALFHFRNNNRSLAWHYLLNCREYRECGETLYLIARAEILEQPELLDSITADTPSLACIRDLLKARFMARRGRTGESLILIRKVIRESEAASLPRHAREARLALAETLEESGDLAGAGRIFRTALEENHSLDKIDVILPFSNTAERELNGLIRCLVGSGRVDQARETIQKAASLKTAKGVQFLRELKENPEGDSKGIHSRAVQEMEGGSGRADGKPGTLHKPPAGTTMIEFWPDGKEIFVWIDNPGTHDFMRLGLEQRIGESISGLTDSLYSREPFLGPEPPAGLSERLYRQIFQPLERRIREKRLLIIVHKELQSLPLEMLRTGPGRYLLEKYTFSYLPGLHYLGRSDRTMEPPLLVQPPGFRDREGATLELRSLGKLYPGLRSLPSLDIRGSLTGEWIHIASHLRLDRRYWLNSSLDGGGSSRPMTDLLKADIHCQLLSLGMCESANSATAASPYWMGFSEILLLNGADTLLTSRWRMDELTANIYTEFFRLCRRGMPMDEALRNSRLRFLNPAGAGLPPQADHPFYWAGITYVGEPGRRLPVYRETSTGAGIFPILFWLILMAGTLLGARISSYLDLTRKTPG